MYLRVCVQPYISEDTRKSEEILILAPAPGSKSEDHYRKLVLSLSVNKRSEVKIRRRKAVLGIPHVASVKPYGDAAFDSLERYAYGTLFKSGRQREILHIACDRIEIFRYLSGLDFFKTIPRILGVRILGMTVSFSLDMGGHPDLFPLPAVVIQPVKVLHTGLIVDRMVKPPYTV